MFTLPDELPATVAELDQLRDRAQKDINVIRARHDAEEELSRDDVDTLRGLLDAVEIIDTARGEAAASEQQHRDSVADLMNRANNSGDSDADADEDGDADDADDAGDDTGNTEQDADGEQSEDRELVTASADNSGRTGSNGRRPVSFAGVGADEAPANEGPGWQMQPGAPGYRAGRVGFRELAESIDSVRPGSRSAFQANRSNQRLSGREYARQVVASLQRDVPLVDDSHALVAAIDAATDQTRLPGGSLTASGGGWCSPSEQLYDFCDVPDAVDLVSLPEITINRGGVRWPNEPDYSNLYDNLGFHFTEPELEETDSDGNPTAVKECLDIPCPDEFTELRLEAIGLCVEAGILQTQGWPELIENFMRHATNGHLRGVSKLTIEKMVKDSTAVDLTGSGASKYVSASSSVLNGLALQAVNLRLNKGLARGTTIEGVAPSWFAEILRADLAQQEGLAVKSVSDAQINGWLADRNIALQYVGDWQSRGDGQPGNLTTTAWPSTAKVMLYPAGTWFRSMSNVIELGVMYPKEQLQVNRYTRFFTEDAIAVGKRCNHSLVVELPLSVNGGIGERISVSGGSGNG